MIKKTKTPRIRHDLTRRGAVFRSNAEKNHLIMLFEHLKAAGHKDALWMVPGAYPYFVLKPSNKTEAQFYIELSQKSRHIQKWFPTIQDILHFDQENDRQQFDKYGIVPEEIVARLDKTRQNNRYAIIMENVTAGLQLPSVMDVKLGRYYWGDDASEEKKHRLNVKSKMSTSWELYARVAGAIVSSGYPFKSE